MASTKSQPEDQTHHQSPPSQPQFAHAATRVAVAQICGSAGFRGSQPPAFEALTRISTLYLQALARSAAAHAAVAGRTQCNVFDVLAALEELAAPRGFAGASRVDRSLLSSSTLREIRRFVNVTEELPFAKSLPVRWDDHGSRVWSGNSGFGDDRRRRLEIPSWLPEFPDVGAGFEGVDDHERSELHWEENRVEEGEWWKRQRLLKEEDERGKLLPMIRERVKFRVGMGKEKMGVLSKSNGIDGTEKGLNGGL